MFALFAEVERNLVVERTRDALSKARVSGKKFWSSNGSLGVSCLDGMEHEIHWFLELVVAETVVARLTGVSRSTL